MVNLLSLNVVLLKAVWSHLEVTWSQYGVSMESYKVILELAGSHVVNPPSLNLILLESVLRLRLMINPTDVGH